MKTALLTALVLSLTACGSSDDDLGSGGGSSGGAAGSASGGTAGSASGGSSGSASGGSSGSASGGAAGSGGSSSASVNCGTGTTCSGGDSCCIPIQVSKGPACSATCDTGTSQMQCDGPEDCNGNACCGSLAKGWACTGNAACPSGVSQLCQKPSDCGSNQCIPITVAGLSIGTCQP